jgi:hypothetical protein
MMLLFFAAAIGLQAQTPPGGEYYIHGIYTPTIANVQKIDMRPEPIDTILPDRPVTYQMIPAQGHVPARVDTIAPAKLNVLAAQPRLYKAYVKGGFGLYSTPLGEFYFNSTRSRKNAYGIHLKHMSSNGGLSDVGPSDYSFNNIDGFYKHFLPKHEIEGRLIFDRRRISYYGYDELTDSILNIQNVTPVAEDDVKQVYTDIGFAGRLRSMYGDSTRISHDVRLATNVYNNLTGSSEINVRINGDVAKTEGSETYGLGLLIDNNAYRREEGEVLQVRQAGTLLGLLPTVSTSGSKYLVRVGAGIYVDAMGETNFHFYPQAYLEYRLFNDILVPYVGADGAKLRNTFRSLTRENPFLHGAPELKNTSKRYDLYGGVRGSFTKDLGFDVRISQRRMDDMPLFITIPNAPFGDQMYAFYDRVDIFNASATLHYHLRDEWDVHGRVDISSYESDLQAEAWNLLPYQISLGAQRNLRNKLFIKFEAQFLGERPAKRESISVSEASIVPQSELVDLDAFLDLYLGLEYRYTKRLSVFLDVSNLSLSKYERWYRYPVQRGLVIGGFTYSF